MTEKKVHSLGETGVNGNLGDRPIRMRGFYRAIKRGDDWALRIWELKDKNFTSYFLALLYRNIDFVSVFNSTNTLFDLIKKQSSFQGSYLPVPITYGKDEKKT